MGMPTAVVGEGEAAPGPGELKGVGVFGRTAEEAERVAKAYLGQGEAMN